MAAAAGSASSVSAAGDMLVEKDLTIHNVTVERDAARSELKSASEHCEQYRAIASASERSLAELQERAAAERAEAAAALEAARAELARLQAGTDDTLVMT